MNNNSNFKLIMLVFLPFIIGYFIDLLVGVGFTTDNQIYISMASPLLTLWSYGGAVAFWFYVGRKFGSLNMAPIKSFILGNIVWGIFLIIYIWQFVVLDDASRNFYLADIPQHYVLGFVTVGTSIMTMFTRNIHGSFVIFISFLFMIIVYSVGFRSALRTNRRSYV